MAEHYATEQLKRIVVEALVTYTQTPNKGVGMAVTSRIATDKIIALLLPDAKHVPMPLNWTPDECFEKDRLDRINTEQGLISDPMERMMYDALSDAGIEFEYDGPRARFPYLDFTLPDEVYIEVKRFHTPRISDQMSRVTNVIAVQGKQACEFMARAVRALAREDVQHTPDGPATKEKTVD